MQDPDWNPAVDKQAAARCWRDGQKKRCFTYRFLATGTVEEKIFQRQLSKEGLQSVVDDKAQVNSLSTKDLRNLFKLRSGTPSDTHDKLLCDRCRIIADDAEAEAQKALPKKLFACRDLLDRMMQQEDAGVFKSPFVPTDHGVSGAEYEKLVKQPIDLDTVRRKLDPLGGKSAVYCSVSGFSKDVNKVFSNVAKVALPDSPVAESARRLRSWWIEQWTQLVPVLMRMRSDSESLQSADEKNEHNERGEDFQGQIGMPDEEDMRSWSHHYTTDTVDDPVFRAAMNGYDSVSFVFGLEVTWSLIQQRQQEEEERRAMDELGGESNGDVEPTGETVGDSERGAEQHDEESSEGTQTDSMNGGTESEDQSIQEATSETDDASIAEACSDRGESVGHGQGRHTDTPLENDANWDCTACTFRNVANCLKCQICGARCPSPRKKPKIDN